MKYAMFAVVLLGLAFIIIRLAGCGVEGKMVVSERSLEVLKTFQEKCDGNVLYEMNHQYRFLSNDRIIYYHSFKCIPNGVEIIVQ